MSKRSPRSATAAFTPGIGAFSMVELLAVMAVISIMSAFSVPAIQGIMGGSDTSRTLALVTQSSAIARQTAMSTGTVVAMIYSMPVADAPQGLILYKQKTTGTSVAWEPLTAWTPLPNMMQIQEATAATFLDQSGTDSIPVPLSVKLGENEVNAYKYILFLPDGSVEDATNKSASTLSIQQVRDSSVSLKYVALLQKNTGRIKIIEQ